VAGGPAGGASRTAWQAPARWDTPSLRAFSGADPTAGPMAPRSRAGACWARAGRNHPTIAGAGRLPRAGTVSYALMTGRDGSMRSMASGSLVTTAWQRSLAHSTT